MRCCCSLSSFRLPGRSHAGTHSYCRRVAGVDSTHVIPWKIKCTQFTLCKSQCSAQPLSAIPGCWSAVFSATGAFLATCRLVHRLARDEHVSGSISNGIPLAHPISIVCLQPISPFPAIAMKHWIPFYPFSARALQRCCCTCEKKKNHISRQPHRMPGKSRNGIKLLLNLSLPACSTHTQTLLAKLQRRKRLQRWRTPQRELGSWGLGAGESWQNYELMETIDSVLLGQ